MKNRAAIWHVYIARCGDGSLYTGVTTDLQKRLRRHNAGRGSAYVRSTGSATLIYAETCADKSAAHRREIDIKSWRRKKKLSLIASPQGLMRVRTHTDG